MLHKGTEICLATAFITTLEMLEMLEMLSWQTLFRDFVAGIISSTSQGLVNSKTAGKTGDLSLYQF